MYDYDRRIAAKMKPEDWKHSGGQWMFTVKYSDGGKYDWAIKQVGGKFKVSVRTPDGVLTKKTGYDTLEQAQKYAWKFIDRADGKDLLEKAKKDFTEG